MSDNSGTNVSDLSHSFPLVDGQLEVLKDISFSVGGGEILAILGPSGCGKSTLLRCVAGLIRFNRGNVAVAGMRPEDALKARAVGFAFQEPGLLPWRTTEENILLPAELGPKGSGVGKLDSRVEELLELVGLTGFRQFLPKQLSGGMKQRVSLARALLLQPRLLLLDEPFGSLDVLTRTTLSEELGRIIHTTGIPTVIVTHSIEEAVFLGTRLIVLSASPARVVETIDVELETPRDLAVLERPTFVKLVARCRSLLMKGGEVT